MKALDLFCGGFQFQTGSIKSVANTAAVKALTGFNSKLVRLKAPSNPFPILNNIRCFNSKLVRLKECSQFQCKWFSTCFNSKLVRLKATFLNSSMDACYMFQFQTGSIKSGGATASATSLLLMFQFQTGSIKSAYVLKYLRVLKMFQFQTGSIKSHNTIFHRIIRTLVSIPNWFD